MAAFQELAEAKEVAAFLALRAVSNYTYTDSGTMFYTEMAAFQEVAVANVAKMAAFQELTVFAAVQEPTVLLASAAPSAAFQRLLPQSFLVAL